MTIDEPVGSPNCNLHKLGLPCFEHGEHPKLSPEATEGHVEALALRAAQLKSNNNLLQMKVNDLKEENRKLREELDELKATDLVQFNNLKWALDRNTALEMCIGEVEETLKRWIQNNPRGS